MSKTEMIAADSAEVPMLERELTASDRATVAASAFEGLKREVLIRVLALRRKPPTAAYQWLEHVVNGIRSTERALGWNGGLDQHSKRQVFTGSDTDRRPLGGSHG